ncbi:hypothetical protein DDW02_00585 [Acidilobus sp. SCGC AC-742_M05]|nr:hypothetical protein DDW02_00585 [Acidilobus sp. SCGC AC-742_M05]
MTGPEGPREAQERATGEGRGGEGHSQALSLAFLLAFSLTLVAFMPVIWPMPLQRLLGHPLAQYVIWLRCRGLNVGLDVFGSLVPMAVAALLAVALRARGLGALLPFAARGASVARLLAYAAVALLAIGAMIPLASPSVALMAVRGSAAIAAVLALCLVYAVPVVAAVTQVMRPRGQPLHLLAERAGPWLAAEAYVTALALSLLADTFAVVPSCVAELRGLLPWPTYLVYGGYGLTDGLVLTPIGVAMAALAAVGLFKLIIRGMQLRPVNKTSATFCVEKSYQRSDKF